MDPATMMMVADAGMQLFGGMFGRKGQQDVNAQNIAFAREQMDFQERMSSTAHQREVEDLKKAGLNPILSAFGRGASSPPGAVPVLDNPNRGISIPNMVSNALQIATTRANINLTKEQAETEKSEQELNRANANAARGTIGAFGSKLPIGSIAQLLFSGGSGTASNAMMAAMVEQYLKNKGKGK